MRLRSFQTRLITLLIALFIFEPLLTIVAPQVSAAASSTTNQEKDPSDEACRTYIDSLYNPDFSGDLDEHYIHPDTEPVQTEEEEYIPDSFIQQVFSITDLKNDDSIPETTRTRITSQAYIYDVIRYYGIGLTYYKAPSNAVDIDPDSEWVVVCDTASQVIDDSIFSPYSTFDPVSQRMTDLLEDPNPKITFKNLADKYALLGEPCPSGFSIPFDQWTADGPNPCKNFNIEDDFFPNGVWDAPKVDRRVIDTLTYLTTPVERGGAGREHIRVKKIVTYLKDTEFKESESDQPPVVVDTSTDAQNADDVMDGNVPTAADPTEQEAQISSFFIDPNDSPHKPRRLARSVQIDEIDYVRVGTKIVEKRLLGNNTTTYKYQPPFPVKVGWQSDEGMAQDPPPDFSNLSTIESARYLTNAAIVQLLNQYGLGDLEIDVSQVDINDFGDIALLVGQSLLEQLLGSPKGSLRGWDLISTLKSIGLAYLEQQLGLLPGSLADPNPLDKVDDGADFTNLTASIGRNATEYLLGFPRGSLRSSTGKSRDILDSIGKRYLENQVFKVSEGTLTADDNHPLEDVGDLLERLGEGRMEYIFKLPKQSVRNAATYAELRGSNYKAGLLFPEASKEDYEMADFVSNQLDLAYVPYRYVRDNGGVSEAGSNMYGFSSRDFEAPSVSIAPKDLKKFKRLVGSRAIETSIGIFRREGVNTQLPANYDPGTSSLIQPPSKLSGGPEGYNYQLRPNSGGFFNSNNWCAPENSSFYSDYLPATSNPDAMRQKLTEIKKTAASYGPAFSVQCVATNSLINNADYGFMQAINDYFFELNPVSQLQLRNQQGEPSLNDMAFDNLEQTGSRLRRYNTALLLYYNLPENHVEIPINTINPGNPDSTTLANGTDKVLLDDNRTTLGELLKKYSDWDSNFKDRLDMLGRRFDAENQQYLYNLFRYRDLPQQDLNRALITALNTITVKPKAGPTFAEEYPKDEYNGWLYLLQDMKNRLSCMSNEGTFVIVENKTSCETGGRVLSGTEKQEMSEAIRLINQAYKAPWTMVATIVASLDSGTVADGSLFTNQSMMSAATSLAGMSNRMDGNRRFLADDFFYQSDLMRKLTSPAQADNGVVLLDAKITDFFTMRDVCDGKPTSDAGGDCKRTDLGEIGRMYAAKQFGSGDILTQRTFMSQLRTDYAQVQEGIDDSLSIFDRAVEDSDDFGLEFGLLEDKGLNSGDFQRIFMLDDANSVFERIGKEELLRTVWQRTGAAAKIKSSQQYQGLMKELRKISQTLEFYVSRLDRVKVLSNDLVIQLNGIGGDFTEAKTSLDNLRKNQKINKQTSNIEQLRQISRSYEPVLQRIRVLADQDKERLASIRAQSYEILHLLQEIAAGRELPRQQFGDIDPNSGLVRNGNNQDDPCFIKLDILASLTGGGNVFSKLVTAAERIGACRLDTGFSLPRDTMYTWYQLGNFDFPPSESERPDLWKKDDDGKTIPAVPSWKKNSWSLDNLRMAAGLAAKNRDEQILSSPDPESLLRMSADEINALYKRGERIINAAMVSSLGQLIPGLGAYLRKNGLTGEDLSQILQGNLRPLIEKIGGNMLDKALNLPKGSAAAIIYPTCRDRSGKIAACNKQGGPGTDPDNMRMQTIASIGLTTLGLTVPDFPRYFNFTSGGNILDNWGNALISERLGLKPNSFLGNIRDFATGNDPNYSTVCETTTIRCDNSTSTLMRVFGLSTLPYFINLENIRTNFRSYLTENINDPSLLITLNSSLDSVVERIYNEMSFAHLYDPEMQQKGYWSKQGDPSFAENINNLIQKDYIYWTQNGMKALWDSVEPASSGLTAEQAVSLRYILVSNQSEIAKSDKVREDLARQSKYEEVITLLYLTSEAVQTLFVNRYTSYVTYFQGYLDRLNTRFSFDSNHNFTGFLRGEYDASKMNTSAAMQGTVSLILGNKFDKWIDEQGPDWLQDLNLAFGLVTKDPKICGQEKKFGSFLASTMLQDGSNCNVGALKNASLNTMLYSDAPNYKALRDLIFTRYLSKVFSAELEKKIGLGAGTFRAIAADPKHTSEILITQGVLLAADRIFGPDIKYDPCDAGANIDYENCAKATVISTARQAFLAGFYDPERKTYTLEFSDKRAVHTFSKLVSTKVYETLTKQLNIYSRKYIGVDLTPADIDLIVHGDNRGYTLIGLQFIANQLNSNLIKGDASRNPAARYFYIRYADVREAAGLPSAAALRELQGAAEYNFLRNAVCSDGNTTSIECASKSAVELRKMYEQQILDRRIADLESYNDPSTSQDRRQQIYDERLMYADLNQDGVITLDEEEFYLDGSSYEASTEIKNAGVNDSKNDLRQRRRDALEALKYAMLDLAAFQLDQHIPVGFSRRLLAGNMDARIDAIAQYMFNRILDSKSGELLQTICGGSSDPTGDCYSFLKDFALALTSKNVPAKLQEIFLLDKNQIFIDNIDRAFTGLFEKQFGIELPDGLFRGIYVWGMTGFKKGDFNKEVLCFGGTGPDCLGGKTGVPIGRILQDFGIDYLTDFADKALGLKKGTAAKIVHLYELISTMQKLTSTGAQAVNVIQEVSTIDGTIEGRVLCIKNCDQIGRAKMLNAIKAEIASLVAEIITSQFSEQLLSIDKSLGLPMGTMSIVANAAITYIVADILGNPSAILGGGFFIGVAIALGITLIFGVVSVEITNRATTDGYYPFYNFGTGGGWKPKYFEHHLTDAYTGEFDPTDSVSYRFGLKMGAREKVKGLLIDLLNMPASDWAANHGIDANSLWIEQLFTYGNALEYNPLLDPRVDRFYTLPAPFNLSHYNSYFEARQNKDPELNGGWGYGTVTQRCEKVTYNENANTLNCTRPDSIRYGFYPVRQMVDAVHIRW